jgi:transposase InsO family protein
LRIKKIRNDNGTKFKNSQIEGFLEEGIKHEFSSPYTPQKNGVVERKNRTLLDMARTIESSLCPGNRIWMSPRGGGVNRRIKLITLKLKILLYSKT